MEEQYRTNLPKGDSKEEGVEEEVEEVTYLGPVTPGKCVGVQRQKVRRFKASGQVSEVLSERFTVERDGDIVQDAEDANGAQSIADFRNKAAAKRPTLGQALGKGVAQTDSKSPGWKPPRPE